jgi:predicted helicase
MAEYTNLTALDKLLKDIQNASLSERQKGTFFENLTMGFFRHEVFHADTYPQIGRYADWAQERGLSKSDIGIDLVVSMAELEDRFCAIHCKIYADRTLNMDSIKNFLTLSG